MAKFSELTSRITGFSCPIFGVSWDPARSDVEVARGVVVFLEDRRVLYAPGEAEMPAHCVESVLEMRRFLTDRLVGGRLGDELAGHIRAIRAACRQFLADMDADDEEPELWVATRDRRSGGWYNGLQDYRLNQALGVLRATVGVHVAQIAVAYGVDIEPPLDSILPPEPA